MKSKGITRHLSELNNLIQRAIIRDETEQKMAKSGLSLSNACIITYLNDHTNEDIFQRDLEREFRVRRSTMSKTLTALENKGYIKRISVISDHRLKKITLTDKAYSVADKVKQSYKALDNIMMSGISNTEYEQLIKTIEKIKLNLSKEEPDCVK